MFIATYRATERKYRVATRRSIRSGSKSTELVVVLALVLVVLVFAVGSVGVSARGVFSRFVLGSAESVVTPSVHRSNAANSRPTVLIDLSRDEQRLKEL